MTLLSADFCQAQTLYLITPGEREMKFLHWFFPVNLMGSSLPHATQVYTGTSYMEMKIGLVGFVQYCSHPDRQTNTK